MELYIHIPFCVKKCAYCDFLSAPAGEKTMERYRRALLKEIEAAGMECREKAEAPVTSVFFGGGTPSLFPGAWIEEILSRIQTSFCLTRTAEITIEANPGTVTEQALNRYLEAGVNRLSFGLQSADDGELRTIGRIHTWEMFLQSFRAARQAGFCNINIDLMSGLPGQTKESLRRTLEKAAALEPEHISAYSLILEEGTALYEEVRSGEIRLPDEDCVWEMDRLLQEYLAGAGYRRYEISNYAKPGYECRHNIGYWTGVPYLGFGLGAASYVEQSRFANETDLSLYCKAQGDLSVIRKDRVRLSEHDRMEEFMFLGLRMTDGVSLAEFQKRFGHSFDEVYGDVAEKQESQGLLIRREGRVFLSARGLEVANRVMAEYLF